MIQQHATPRPLGGRLIAGFLGALLLSLLALAPSPAQAPQDPKRAEEIKKVQAAIDKLLARLKELQAPKIDPSKPGTAPWVGTIKVDGKPSKPERAKLAKVSKVDAEKAALAVAENKEAKVKAAELRIRNGFVVWEIDVLPQPANAKAKLRVLVDAGNNTILAPGNQVMVSRTGDQFTASCRDGAAVITVTGTVTAGQQKVAEIAIQDGEKTVKYSDISKVPEQWRSKVQHVIDSADKRNRAADGK
jgi:hypothetical protein